MIEYALGFGLVSVSLALLMNLWCLLRGPGVSTKGEILNPKYIPPGLRLAVRNQSMRFGSKPRALAYVARVLA